MLAPVTKSLSHVPMAKRSAPLSVVDMASSQTRLLHMLRSTIRSRLVPSSLLALVPLQGLTKARLLQTGLLTVVAEGPKEKVWTHLSRKVYPRFIP